MTRGAECCGRQSQRLAAEKLGRVAKVAVEQSFLRCAGQPPAQRDSGYQSPGRLSIQFVFSAAGLGEQAVRPWNKRSYAEQVALELTLI